MRVVELLCADGLPTGTPQTSDHVRGLCRAPDAIPTLSEGAGALVLGLCGGEYALADIQRQVRRACLDPLGVEIVDILDAAGDAERLEILLSAAAARAREFRGSGPEHAKLLFPQAVSRRQLFTRSPEYHAAPAVDDTKCASGIGCSLCVDVCARHALEIVDGSVVYDRARCELCGRCVTSCPTGAIENPGFTSRQLRAQIEALLKPSLGPRGRAV